MAHRSGADWSGPAVRGCPTDARATSKRRRESRDRLGVDAIDLYLLHAVDPKTPLATSVRALARIRDAGVARGVGLSNVNATQLALAIVPVAAVEVELNPWRLVHGLAVQRPTWDVTAPVFERVR